MPDFRLQVFYTVARRMNFTRAAEELYITQPAVTKHIQELEAYYKTRLFERQGTHIKLTPAGKVLLRHAGDIFALYRRMDEDMAALHDQLKGSIRLGASTTVAQYVLPRFLARFREKHPDVSLQLLSGNTGQIEDLLLENKLDLGIVEGQSKRGQLQYTTYLKDELVLCTRSGNPLVKNGVVALSKLPELPMLLREHGSGSLEVLSAALKKKDITLPDLHIEMILQSTESIKAYLLHSDAFAFISLQALQVELQSKLLMVVPVPQLSITRQFRFVQQQGAQQPLVGTLQRFLATNNLRL